MDSNSVNNNRRMSESIYRPNFYRRQRSVSLQTNGYENGFATKEEDIPEEDSPKEIHIRVVRRKSLGYNMKLVNSTTCPPEVVQKDFDNKNELIISIPVLIDDNSSVNKDILKEVLDQSFPNDEPVMQNSWTVLKQMLIPFLIAGIGSVGAGIVLDGVQHWPAFEAIPQLIIMIPSFLGLIGNIETTLASRLSTHSNLGTLDSISELKNMIVGNSAVVLCQAATVGLFAAFASLAMYYMTGAKRSAKIGVGQIILLLCASAVATSVAANVILATAISLVIILARKFNINPDNIATPIAASMGDVCTISILAQISDFFFKHSSNGSQWIPGVTMAVLLITAPLAGYIARKNRYTRSVILTGWTPILGAVIIEQPGGLVMQNAFDKYDVLATFQPLVNGIGSNLVGIQTSRLSTYLHQTAPKGSLPKSHPRACVSPFSTFIGSDIHARMARLLLFISLPTHFLFLVTIFLTQRNFYFTPAFIGSYLMAVFIQIALLLYLAYVSVMWAWKRHINPDNSAIPFTSALADVLGNCLMALAFTFLDSVNDINAQISGDSAFNTTVSTVTYALNSTIISNRVLL